MSETDQNKQPLDHVLSVVTSTPEVKTCNDCAKRFKSMQASCHACRINNYLKRERKPEVYDLYVDDCRACQTPKMHLGPGWCIDCHAGPGELVTLCCQSCELTMAVPPTALDEEGGVVDIVGREVLWCVQCCGPAFLYDEMFFELTT